MVEIADSLLRESSTWPISDESDDLETPLQVWQRLFGNDLIEAQQLTSSCSVRESRDVVTIKRSGAKRKCRRSASSRENQSNSSSEDEVSRGRKKLRHKTRSNARNSQVKTELKSKQNQLSNDESPVIEDEPSPPGMRVMLTRSAKHKQRRQLPPRKSYRNPRKNRKKPLEFLEDENFAVNQTSECTTAADDHVSIDGNLCDSQATILLETPEFLDSLEVSKPQAAETIEKEDEQSQTTCEGSDEEENPIKNDLIVQVEESDPDDTNHSELDKNKVISSDDDTTDIEEENDNTASYLSLSTMKSPHQPPPEIDTTDLDDIFFKPRHSTKRPAPSRTKNQKTTTMQSLIDSSTQESTCSSLLDDDTLWVSK